MFKGFVIFYQVRNVVDGIIGHQQTADGYNGVNVAHRYLQGCRKLSQYKTGVYQLTAAYDHNGQAKNYDQYIDEDHGVVEGARSHFGM